MKEDTGSEAKHSKKGGSHSSPQPWGTEARVGLQFLGQPGPHSKTLLRAQDKTKQPIKTKQKTPKNPKQKANHTSKPRSSWLPKYRDPASALLSLALSAFSGTIPNWSTPKSLLNMVES